MLEQFNHPSEKQWWRSWVFHLGEALGWMQALSPPDPDREAKRTLCNAPTFPAMTRKTSKLLIPETSLGERRSRNILNSQQSLLRSGMEWKPWHTLQFAGPPSSQLPLPLSGVRVCDSGAQHGLASLACLLHCECGVEQPSWRTAACFLSAT